MRTVPGVKMLDRGLQWAGRSLVIVMVMVPHVVSAHPDTLWTRTYGGELEDQGYAVAQSSADGYVIAGLTRSFGAGGRDVYLVNIDQEGDPAWTRMHGTYDGEYANAVAQTADGGFIVAGWDGQIGDSWIYLVRTNAAGGALWQNSYEGDEATAVAESPQGGFIVVGSKGEDVCLMRTDAIGNTAWSKTYGGADPEYGQSFVIGQDGGYIIAGWTSSFGAGGKDVYVIGTNSSGDTLWTRAYGGALNDKGQAVSQTADGGFIVAGMTRSYGEGDADVFLLKMNPYGDTLWTRTYGGLDDDFGMSVVETADSGYIVAGTTYSFGGGEADVYVLRTDSLGNTLWTSTFGGSGDDYGYAIMRTANGGYIIAGSTESYGAGDFDAYVIRIGVGVTPILEPAQTWVPQLGTLDFCTSYINPFQEQQATEVIFEAYLPGGSNPAKIYSDILTFDPGVTVKYYTLTVPGYAPLKDGYRFEAKTVDPPGSEEEVGWDSFVFDVMSPMESVPYGHPSRMTTPHCTFGDPPDTVWTRTYGMSDHDWAESADQTPDGGFIALGTTRSRFRQVNVDEYDLYLIKTDSYGDSLWTRRFGGDDNDFGHAVTLTSDGGYVVVGATSSYGAGSFDVYVIKTNSVGDIIWTKTYGADQEDGGNGVIETSDGGYIVAGWTFSYGEGYADVYLIKTDANGDSLWTVTYGGALNDYGWQVVEAADGGYFVTGWTESFGEGARDVYLIRTDANGDSLWSRTYGGAQSDYGHAVVLNTEGGCLVAGATESSGSGDYDVYVLRIDANGNTLWTRTYGGSGSDYGRSIATTSDGGYLIAGETSSYGAGLNDIYVIKTDADGDTLWTTVSGGEQEEYGFAAVQTVDGGYIAAGRTESYGAGGRDVYLLRLAGTVVTPIVDPAQLWVPRKGSLDYRVAYENWTQGAATVEVGFDVYLPGGSDPAKTFSGTLTFEHGTTIRHYTLTVPSGALIKKGYRLETKIIDPPGSGEVVSKDSYEFEVTPAMGSIP
jgi:hypothetical protein